MAFNPTREQKSAISEKGNILVSAAAGSGKTAVLVERVISLLTDKDSNVSADELLIVTFTNAAAAEMRSRIEKRLDEECRKNPTDAGLLLQKHLLNNAKICTIDSFCIDLVRENFDKLGISPDFKVSDGHSLREINQNVIYGIINKYLEEKNPVFEELLDIIGAEFDERNFAETVMQLYEYSRQLPFPQSWFDSLYLPYQNKEFTSDNIWYKYAFEKAKNICYSVQRLIANTIDLITDYEEASDAYLGFFTDTAKQISSLIDAANTNDWDVFFTQLNNFKPLKLPTVRGLSGISNVTAAKDTYKYICEKSLESLNKIFYADLSFINSQFEKLAEPIKLFVEILKEYDIKIFEEYKNNNTFTFHNTEHLALSLLCKEKDGKITVNPESEEYLNHFAEVMVDEYQDTNDLQDMLFLVLSNFEKKLFAVGDVKQSIYAFRGANPSNFLCKKNRYIDIKKAKIDDPKRIILGNNFRSKPEVCEYINFFFELFMQKEIGEIDYTDGEQLIPTAVFPKTQTHSVNFDIIDCKETDEKSLVLEARRIAEIIEETINGDACIKKDDNTLRKAKYGDFAILLRSMSNKAPIIVNELKKQGIPVNLSFENFTESFEVSTFLALLKIIDNPQSDIELLTVMMSPLFYFSADMMAEIRVNKKDGNLYSAIIHSAKNGNIKCEEFLKTLEKYRLYAVTYSLPKLISKLLIETQYLNIVSAMSDGERRKNNLLLLAEYANQYFQNINSSLSGFVKFIIRQSESGIKSACGSSESDAIKIMSIHASKGLQFPVCILASTASRFNDADVRENAVYTSKLGIGFRYFDETDKTKYTTPSRQVILDDVKNSSLQEELRLLYVAMTRTQDKLYLISSYQNLEKSVDGYKNLLLSCNSKIDNNLFLRTKSYADWLMISSLLHPDGKILRGTGSGLIPLDNDSKLNINIIDGSLLTSNSLETKPKIVDINNDIVSEIKTNLEFKYPYSEILDIQSKTSVSAVANKAESEKYSFTSRPAFLSDGGITATERGTAMHRVMQFFDFEKFNDIDEEIERLYEWQYISEREMQSLNRKALTEFFESSIFERIIKSPSVKREMRFLTEVPATEIDNSLDKRFENEKVIIQGAVDICFVENDELVILDFKTDRVDDINDLANAYGKQLSIYAKACEKIFNKPIKEKIIYSFGLSDSIKI